MAKRQPVGAETSPASTAAETAWPIDQAHLVEMTLGDRRLQREVLELFDRQIELLLDRMRHVEAAGIATLAHTLKGSARGVGAWTVACAAEALESARPAQMAEALEKLVGAAQDARAAIGLLLRSDGAAPLLSGAGPNIYGTHAGRVPPPPKSSG